MVVVFSVNSRYLLKISFFCRRITTFIGKTITTYLIEGTPQGPRMVYVSNKNNTHL